MKPKLVPIACLALLLAMLSVALAACGPATDTVTTASNAGIESTLESMPMPAADMTSVVGQVVSQASGAPLADFPVRLAEVYRNGDQAAYVLDGSNSPGAVTDSQGVFHFKDITAREYVVVVGDVMDVYRIITETDGKAKVYNAAAGKTLNLGILKVDLP